RRSMPAEPADTLPEQLALRALPEDWTVAYSQGAGAQIAATVTAAQHLLVRGPIENVEACRWTLRRWLNSKAHFHLTPWLRQVSQEIGLPFSKISVKGQKTIWASCSGKKNISINYKLLFLPGRLVRYVFIHELCHTIHLNHSKAFWSLVAEKEPHYKRLDHEINKAWRYIPEWVERLSSSRS
ncbi:MAG: M48 family metallopeptidase, partial [Cyanothece sp. SIO1E1]|nr:M48 family metallopeptidase [Cyanothece sp. SIO1E1]